MDQNELQKQFKEIVEKLPADKKKVLYKRLKAMDAEERNKTIQSIVDKENEIIKEKQQNSKPKPAGKPVNMPANKQANKQSGKPANKPANKPAAKNANRPASKPAGKPQGKPQSKPQRSRQPAKQVKAVKQPEKPKAKPEKKKNGAMTAIWVAVLVMGIALLGFTGYNKRESLIELWNNVTGATAATELSETEPSETAEPTPTPTPTPSPSPTPTPVPLAHDAPDLTGMTIVLDPGHQQTTSETTEKVASWLSAEKPRCTCGGEGVSTGIPEYDLTLRFCVMLKEYLEGCGATVIMTRTVNDVDLSNQERAQMATSANCNLFLRIHADSANDSMTSGIQMYVPSQGNNYRTDMSRAQSFGEDLCEATGLAFNGVRSTEVYTGLNYATSVHALQISLGYLTNSDDEAVITDEEMQYDMVVVFAQFCAQYK